jgi:hypothetical protein
MIFQTHDATNNISGYEPWRSPRPLQYVLNLHVSGCRYGASCMVDLCELHGEFVREQYGNNWRPSALKGNDVGCKSTELKATQCCPDRRV